MAKSKYIVGTVFTKGGMQYTVLNRYPGKVKVRKINFDCSTKATIKTVSAGYMCDLISRYGYQAITPDGELYGKIYNFTGENKFEIKDPIHFNFYRPTTFWGKIISPFR